METLMPKTGKVLLWRGCTYRKQLGEELESIESVLGKLDVAFETVEEKCCGYPLFLAGYPDDVKSLAEEFVEVVRPFGLVVTACPACLRAFREVYQEQLKIEIPDVLHLTEFLAKKADEGVLKVDRLRAVDMKVMYHDPCELGRALGVYEDPRRLLSLIPGLRVFEQRFTRENSACCGGGGLLPAFFGSLSTMAASRMLTQEDRVPEDLDAVVTTCPQCIVNMRRGVEMWVEGPAKRVKVVELAQVLDEALR